VTAGWPVELTGITESVVATEGPDGVWNLAALGLRAGEFAADSAESRVTARTWGRTRTRINFERRGTGVVQFVRDPVAFVDAALGIRESEDPVEDSADAWVEVSVERFGSETRGDTEVVDWELVPERSGVEREGVRTIDRGFNAVVEATVWASRLGVEGYDEAELLDRLRFLGTVVDRSGSDRERAAFEKLETAIDRPIG
jgi:hypothetical protein